MSRDRIFTLLSRKLTDEATASELAELDNLIRDCPDHKIPLALIKAFWNTAAEQDKDFLEATYHLHLNRLKEEGFDLTETKTDSYDNAAYIDLPASSFKKKYFKQLVAGCTFLIAAIALFFILNSGNKKIVVAGNADTARQSQSEVSTKNGSRSKIQLPDGTSVWLNGSSKLVYNNEQYGKTIREVTLTGEGYFDVVKNAEKPFIIHTGRMDIKVLGTVFNVKCYPGEKSTETSLIRGSIEVTLKNRKEKILLKASEKLIISDEEISKPARAIAGDNVANKEVAKDIIVLRHLTALPQDSTIVETAWVENKLVFNNETFEEVALKMERWYNVEIKFIDESLKTERLSGSFEKETTEQAFAALRLAAKFSYVIKDNKITLNKTGWLKK
jgi:transmembrane sensor